MPRNDKRKDRGFTVYRTPRHFAYDSNQHRFVSTERAVLRNASEGIALFLLTELPRFFNLGRHELLPTLGPFRMVPLSDSDIPVGEKFRHHLR